MMTEPKNSVDRKASLVEVDVVAIDMLPENMLRCFDKQSAELGDCGSHIAVVIISQLDVLSWRNLVLASDNHLAKGNGTPTVFDVVR
jgi:hypothetical protein